MNEVRLIDANALKEELAKSGYDIVAFGGLFYIIDNAPTVEAIQYTLGYQDGFLEGKKICERPHGEWLFNTTFWNCSVCKKTAQTIEYCGDERFMNEFFKFCPNCGADMRPEKKVRIPSCLTNPERQAELLERYKEE